MMGLQGLHLHPFTSLPLKDCQEEHAPVWSYNNWGQPMNRRWAAFISWLNLDALFCTRGAYSWSRRQATTGNAYKKPQLSTITDTSHFIWAQPWMALQYTKAKHWVPRFRPCVLLASFSTGCNPCRLYDICPCYFTSFTICNALMQRWWGLIEPRTYSCSCVFRKSISTA